MANTTELRLTWSPSGWSLSDAIYRNCCWVNYTWYYYLLYSAPWKVVTMTANVGGAASLFLSDSYSWFNNIAWVARYYDTPFTIKFDLINSSLGLYFIDWNFAWSNNKKMCIYDRSNPSLPNYLSYSDVLLDEWTNWIDCPQTSNWFPLLKPPAPPATCSDWIKNQNETDIDFGGTCACYSKDIETGKTLLPYVYNTNFIVDKSSSYFSDYERVRTLRNWYSEYEFIYYWLWIYSYSVTSDKASLTGSLQSVLSHSTGAIAIFSGKPQLSIVTLPAPNFGDVKTTDFSSSWSNAINYVRVVTDTPWHLEAKIIRNIAYSWSINNSEDADYTRIESGSWVAYLSKTWGSRDFKIVFDSTAPTIYSIDWGSYTRASRTDIVCPVSAIPETLIEAQQAYLITTWGSTGSGSNLITISSGNATIDKLLQDSWITKTVQSFLNIVPFAVPTDPSLSVSIILPKWYPTGKIGAESYSGTLVAITDRAHVTNFTANPIKKPLVVLFSILLYTIFVLFVASTLIFLPYLLFSITQKVTSFFLPFVKSTQGNFATLLFALPLALAYIAIVATFIPLYQNISGIFISAKQYLIAFISLINVSWGSYVMFSTTINILLTLIYATIGGSIVYKLADKYLRVN